MTYLDNLYQYFIIESMFLYFDWKYEFYQRYITRDLITWQWLAKKNCKENISRDVDNEIEGWKIEKI